MLTKTHDEKQIIARVAAWISARQSRLPLRDRLCSPLGHSVSLASCINRPGISSELRSPVMVSLTGASGYPLVGQEFRYSGAEQVIGELQRTHAFDRKVLAVVTTTGRGWVNPNVAAAFEYVNSGDTAIASMQYSFLPSALSFIADRETPPLAGQALFEAVHRAWAARTQGQRPKLVVFGGSLGSFGGQSAFASRADILSRTDGALLVGTPNFAQPWAGITANRDPGSFERLPIVDDGRHIRFASRPHDVDLTGPWEFPRVVFWQHASDPITWWSVDLFMHRPDWLREPLGPDVDPGMRWLPFVTFWQVTLDMIFSADVPYGYGHAFGPDAAELWVDILAPPDWDPPVTERIHDAVARG